MPNAATARELIIDIPSLPPSVLLPNRKAHWATKARAAAEYGQVVKLCAIDARNRWEEAYAIQLDGGRRAIPGWQPLPKATIQLIFTFPLRRRGPAPDPDNLMAAFKSGLDALTARDRGNGVVGAGIIEDDGPENITPFPPVIVRGEYAEVRVIVRDGMSIVEIVRARRRG